MDPHLPDPLQLSSARPGRRTRRPLPAGSPWMRSVLALLVLGVGLPFAAEHWTPPRRLIAPESLGAPAAGLGTGLGPHAALEARPSEAREGCPGAAAKPAAGPSLPQAGGNTPSAPPCPM